MSRRLASSTHSIFTMREPSKPNSKNKPSTLPGMINPKRCFARSPPRKQPVMITSPKAVLSAYPPPDPRSERGTVDVLIIEVARGFLAHGDKPLRAIGSHPNHIARLHGIPGIL